MANIARIGKSADQVVQRPSLGQRVSVLLSGSQQSRLEAEMLEKRQLVHSVKTIQHEDGETEYLSVADEAKRRPALRFIWENCDRVSAKVAIETILHVVMSGARSTYEHNKNAVAFLDAVNRCEDSKYAITKSNDLLFDREGYEKIAVAAISTLALKISDPLERELQLRTAALNGPTKADPAWELAGAWEKSIQEIGRIDPAEAAQRAARAYAEAKCDSAIAITADRYSTQDLNRWINERGDSRREFIPKRQRHPGPQLKLEGG